jgi:hypothetical protein
MRILSILVVTAALAGCGYTCHSSDNAAPTTTAPATVTPSPTATTIPIDAFLHREDTAFGPGPVPTDLAYGPRDDLSPPSQNDPPLPRPCRNSSHASDRRIVQRATGGIYIGHYSVDGPTQPTIVFETITRYSGSGARDYLAEVRRDVAACPSIVRNTLTFRHAIVRTGFAGDESIAIAEMVRERYVDEAPWVDNTYLIIVIRLRDTVVVLYDEGWEAAPTDGEEMYQLAGSAEARARAWLERI